MRAETESAGRHPSAVTKSNPLQTTTKRGTAQRRIGTWQGLSSVAAGFFSGFIAELDREEAADPEPSRRFFPDWYAWQRRHWERETLRCELREAEALTVTEDDPAPLAREGLAAFLDWSKRQDMHRAARSRRRDLRPA